MKEYTRRRNQRIELKPLSVSLTFVFTIVLCGIIAGSITASYMSIETKTTVNGCISSFVAETVSSTGYKSNLIKSALSLIIYPLSVFCMGYTAFGVVGIPIIVCAKVFLLSFSISSVFKVLGYKGITLALAIYGLQAMILLPCIVLVSVFSMNTSIGIFKSIRTSDQKKHTHIPHKRYFLIFGTCIVAVFFTAVIDAFCTPVLIELASEIIM